MTKILDFLCRLPSLKFKDPIMENSYKTIQREFDTKLFFVSL